mgnify:CR=1 FL=1
MKVKEIKEGKKACVLIDCYTATLYYPKAGQENQPESDCNSMDLEFEEEDETCAVAEAVSILGCTDADIEVSYC